MKPKTCRLAVVTLSILLLGLASWTAFRLLVQPAEGPDPTELGARFRQSRDAQTLHQLMSYLPLGTKRIEVERLLGQPDYSPIADQYYYATNRRSAAGTPIGLVVEYRYTDPRSGEMVSSGKLESIWLGPIAE